MALSLSSSIRLQCGLCNDTLLRHFRHKQLCLFCPTCRQDTGYIKRQPTPIKRLAAEETFTRQLEIEPYPIQQAPVSLKRKTFSKADNQTKVTAPAKTSAINTAAIASKTSHPAA
ncbi:MAG: hypothetical protein AAFU53_05600 [Cyanobacteria bacterium J06632_3]